MAQVLTVSEDLSYDAFSAVRPAKLPKLANMIKFHFELFEIMVLHTRPRHVRARSRSRALTMEYLVDIPSGDILSDRAGYYARSTLSHNELSDFKVYLDRVRSRF